MDRLDKVKEYTKFAKLCLKDEGYSKELVTYLLSTYDLDCFINEGSLNKLEFATHLLGHARKIYDATFNY